MKRKVAVIGIDPDSTRLSAVITLEDDEPLIKRKTLPDKHQVARWTDSAWLFVYRHVRRLVKQGYEVHVFIERPFVSPKFLNAVIPLARLNGAMLAAAHRAGAVTVMDVQIQSWKKSTVGKGSATKPQIEKWCKVYWRKVYDHAQGIPKTRGRQDVMDAAGINRYGKAVVGRMERVHDFKEHEE